MLREKKCVVIMTVILVYFIVALALNSRAVIEFCHRQLAVRSKLTTFHLCQAQRESCS